MHLWWNLKKETILMNLLWPPLLCYNTMTNIMISRPRTSMCVRQTTRMYKRENDDKSSGCLPWVALDCLDNGLARVVQKVDNAIHARDKSLSNG